MRRLFFCLFAVAGCGSLFGGSRAEPVFVAPTTTQRYVNAASPEDKLCYQSGACDAYRLEWAPGTSVRLTLEAEDYATWMEVQCPGAPKRRVDGRPGAPAVVELVRSLVPGVCAILVAGADHDADGEYVLTVGPPPAREDALPPAPSPMTERVATLLARTPPDAAFALGNKDREIALESAKERYSPHGAAVTRRLEAFEPVPVSVETGYCYQVLWRLGDDATWSELSRRGLAAVVRQSDGAVDAGARVVGSGGIIGPACPKTSGELQVSLRPLYAPRGYVAPLGSGDVRLEVHRLAHWPGRKSQAELDTERRTRTRGMSARTKRTVSLDAPLQLDLPLSAGSCTALTLRLDAGSQWTDETLERGAGFNVSLPDADLNAGPGVIGPGIVVDLGCPGVTGTFPARLAAFGSDRLGTGTGTLEIWSRSARPGEVAAEKRRWKDAARDAGADAERSKREHCKKCRTDARGDYEAFDRCVRQWYRTGDCD